jgi:hypothetical protein
MNEIIRVMPKAVAKTAKASGVALINESIFEFAPALAVATRYRPQWESAIGSIGLDRPWRLAEAKQIHNRFLAAVVELAAAYDALMSMVSRPHKIDQASALAMLNVLFAALGRKKSDEESAILLGAAVDMFDPVNDVCGSVTGIAPVSAHPLILALAIKRLIATAKFTSVAELREAMGYVENSLNVKRWHLEYMLENIELADAIVFERDRPTWEANHARCSIAVNRKLVSDLELRDENRYEDDDGVQHPGSPRWQELERIVRAKEAADACSRVREAGRKTDASESGCPATKCT